MTAMLGWSATCEFLSPMVLPCGGEVLLVPLYSSRAEAYTASARHFEMRNSKVLKLMGAGMPILHGFHAEFDVQDHKERLGWRVELIPDL